MSEVASRMSVQEGARRKATRQERNFTGWSAGVNPQSDSFGRWSCGNNAALMAAGLGADVTICDISLPRLRQLK